MIWIYDNFYYFLAEAFIRYIAYDKFSQDLDCKNKSNPKTHFETLFIRHSINTKYVNIIYWICGIFCKMY